MEPIELAYLAGVVDSDGSIMWAKRENRARERATFYLAVKVAWSVDVRGAKETLEWMRAAFGGSIMRTRRANALSLGADMFTWTVLIREAAVFLQAIMPYLRLKRRQAEIVLAAQARKRYSCKLPDTEFRMQKATWMSMKALHGGRGRSRPLRGV